MCVCNTSDIYGSRNLQYIRNVNPKINIVYMSTIKDIKCRNTRVVILTKKFVTLTTFLLLES